MDSFHSRKAVNIDSPQSLLFINSRYLSKSCPYKKGIDAFSWRAIIVVGVSGIVARGMEKRKKSEKRATSTSFPPSPFSTREKDAVIKRLSSFPQAQTGYAPVTFIILRDISSSDDVLEMEVPQEVNLVTVLL